MCLQDGFLRLLRSVQVSSQREADCSVAICPTRGTIPVLLPPLMSPPNVDTSSDAVSVAAATAAVAGQSGFIHKLVFGEIV